MSMYTHDYTISAVFHLGPPRQLRTGRVGGLDETDGFVKHVAPLRRSLTAVSRSHAPIASMKTMVL